MNCTRRAMLMGAAALPLAGFVGKPAPWNGRAEGEGVAAVSEVWGLPFIAKGAEPVARQALVAPQRSTQRSIPAGWHSDFV